MRNHPWSSVESFRSLLKNVLLLNLFPILTNCDKFYCKYIYIVPAAYKNMWGEGLLWYVNLPPKEGTRIGTEGDLNNTSPMSRARHWGNLHEGNLLWRAIVSEEKIASHSGIFSDFLEAFVCYDLKSILLIDWTKCKIENFTTRTSQNFVRWSSRKELRVFQMVEEIVNRSISFEISRSTSYNPCIPIFYFWWVRTQNKNHNSRGFVSPKSCSKPSNRLQWASNIFFYIRLFSHICRNDSTFCLVNNH